MRGDDLMTFIHQIELFHGLETSQLACIASLSLCQSYPAGAVIFAQESLADAVYIIGEGQVEVLIGNQTTPALYLGAGQVFGEMALVDSGTRSATIRVVDDNTTIYRIPSADFLDLCQRDTAIGYLLMRNIAQDLSFKLRHRHLETSEPNRSED